MRERLRSFLGGDAGAGLEALRVQLGGLEARIVRGAEVSRLREAEFRVFSQFGEDGIIQYLLGCVEIPEGSERFVEFGVESYRESNTRFLLMHDNWAGLILDGGDAHIGFVERSGLRWRHTIDAFQLFIDRDNLEPVLVERGFGGELGLLSIDIDGNDYWVWESLKHVDPRIVVVEYNSVFGPTATVSIPYDPGFARAEAHYSHLYWGASLNALVHLGVQKGHRFVGSNSAGNNAFFVRDDVAGDLRARTSGDEWVASRFRESRAPDGSLTYVTSHEERRRLISGLPVVDVTSGETVRVADVE